MEDDGLQACIVRGADRGGRGRRWPRDLSAGTKEVLGESASDLRAKTAEEAAGNAGEGDLRRR
jgi:hypothetical protein